MNISVDIFRDHLDYKTKQIVEGRGSVLGYEPEKMELVHSVSFDLGFDEDATYVELYLDEICKAAWSKLPSQYEEAVISMLTGELLAKICSQEWFQRFHRDEFLNDWLKIGLIDEFLEQVLNTHFGAQLRRNSASQRVIQRLRR
jgi:hypothetical protein